MSGGMTFEGALCYATDEARDAASAALGPIAGLLKPALRNRAILISAKLTAPSSIYDDIKLALWTASRGSIGEVICTYEGDDPELVAPRPSKVLGVSGRSVATTLAPADRWRENASAPVTGTTCTVLVVYAFLDDTGEPAPGTPAFVAGTLGPQFDAAPAPRYVELPAVELATLLNTRLAEPSQGELRATLEELRTWVHASGASIFQYQLEPPELAGDGRAFALASG